MLLVNLHAAWVGILCGCLAGAAQGLLFHREEWLGGYASWRRRMVRLGHVSFFGIAFINLAFFFSSMLAGRQGPLLLVSRLLLVGAVGMPLVCYLSAADKRLRHLFPVPVTCIIAAVAIFLLMLLGAR